MAGKRMTPQQINDAAVLRAAGYALAAIAERLNVSPRILQRHYKAHHINPGMLKGELIAQGAREDLLDAATASAELKVEAARLLVDDIASARLIHERRIAARLFIPLPAA
jgi:hypothetical protein